MSVLELKNKLIEKIHATNDENLLRDATRLLDLELNDLEVPFQLTPEMEEAIEEAQEQIKNGEYLTHSEANKEMEKWLEE